SSGIITTSIAFTSRSAAALREKCLANRRRFGPSLPTTHGGTIAAVCSRCRSRRNLRIRHRQVLGFKPARRLEEGNDEHCERTQEREHHSRSCDDSTRRSDCPA